MGLTHLPHGLLATPNLGGSQDFAGFFETNVYFVDGDNGSDSNEGTEMESPKATIQAAITAASAQDTIYIRVKAPDADASEPGTYIEDLTIPYAKHGLKLIGCTNQLGSWGGPKIKNASASALLTVNASNVHIENLQFNCTRNSGTYGILLNGNTGYTTAAGSVGTTITNCMIKNAGTTYGGINIVGGYGCVISDCNFYSAIKGVYFSSTALPGNQHLIQRCNFVDNNGAALASHIEFAAGTQYGFVIRECTFGEATAFINTAGNVSGIISACHFEDLVATLANSTGKVKIAIGSEVAVTGCFGGVGLAVIQSQA